MQNSEVSPRSRPIQVTIVIPVYNEEANVIELYEQLRTAVNSLDRSFEIIFVDDGSNDKTYENLERIRVNDPRLKIIRNNRNRGQTSALMVGFKHAHGNVVITIDGDLQNDPIDIPRFLEKIEEGFDFVSGWRRQRYDSLIRKLVSILYNYLAWVKTGVRLHDYGCFYCAIKKTLLDRLMKECKNEIGLIKPTIVSLTDSVGEVKISHRARKIGVSKYRWMHIIKLGASFIFDPTTKLRR